MAVSARLASFALAAIVLGVALVLVACRVHPPASVETGQAAAGLLSWWVQLGPEGTASARVVTGQASCPSIVLDGRAQPMQARARPGAGFPVLVCEAPLPPGTAAAAVGGQPLPLPKANPQRIVVVGDTGCRLKEGDPVQACNDPQAWPFAQLARGAAAWQPDLVVHLGDYHYREMPCPPKDSGCAGSPWGDNWAAWNADFFAPAAPLLRAAPWVFSRGNHELCSRAGGGWFRLLDPRPAPVSCQDHTEPYAIPVGDLQLLMLDSAAADDRHAAPEQVAVYAAQFAALRAVAGANAWLITHRPLWAVGHAGEEGGVERLFYTNPTLQAASENALPAGVQLVLTGHIHLFEALDFGAERAPQLVVGNSGTFLDPAVSTPLAGLTVAGATVASGTTLHQFGYLAVEPAGGGWTATLRSPVGATETACAMQDRRATCAP